MTWKTGDLVKITYGGKSVDGMITLASPNGRSLILAWDHGGLLGRKGHGWYLGSMPVLQGKDGVYRDLRTSGEVELEARTATPLDKAFDTYRNERGPRRN